MLGAWLATLLAFTVAFTLAAGPFAPHLTPTEAAYAQQEYSVEFLGIRVFRDGVASVILTVAADTARPRITVPLVSPPAENVVVFDVRERPLAFTLTRSAIAIETLGAPLVTVMYETAVLTSKAGNVWTVHLRTPFAAELTMPRGAAIIYLNALPTSITSSGGRTVLNLEAGEWEIDYVIPLTEVTPEPTPAPPPTATPPTPPVPEAAPTLTAPTEATPTLIPTPTGAPETTLVAPTREEAQTAPIATLPGGIVTLLAVAVAAVGASVALIRVRGKARASRREGGTLRPEEEAALRFLRERGGAAMESEIREHLGMPKSSTWRLIGRLESAGRVKITRVGSQNRVELKE